MSGHGHHRFVDGLVLVVDPFAELLARPGTAGTDDQAAWPEVNPAATDAASVMQPFINRLEQQLDVSAEEAFSIPIAVVVTKMEAIAKTPWGSLTKKAAVGSAVSGRHQGFDKETVAGNSLSSQVRDFLLRLGLANLVAGLEARFRSIAYFTASAIEQLPGQPRLPAVFPSAAPLLWLLEEQSILLPSPVGDPSKPMA